MGKVDMENFKQLRELIEELIWKYSVHSKINEILKEIEENYEDLASDRINK